MDLGILIGIALAISICSIRNERMTKEYLKNKPLEDLKNQKPLKFDSPKLEKIEKIEKKRKRKKND